MAPTLNVVNGNASNASFLARARLEDEQKQQ